MKIILRESYENLGRTGDVVDVKSGFARNYLVPQGIAYPANRFYLRRFEAERAELERKDAQARSQAEGVATQAKGIEIEYIVPMGDRGKMHGAITSIDVAKSLAEKDIEVDRRKINLPQPIKTFGDHVIKVKLHGDVGFIVTVHITPEAPPEEELDDEELAALEAERAEAEALEAEETAVVVEMEEAVPAGDTEVVEVEPVEAKPEEEKTEE